jgi:hypothetical protein
MSHAASLIPPMSAPVHRILDTSRRSGEDRLGGVEASRFLVDCKPIYHPTRGHGTQCRDVDCRDNWDCPGSSTVCRDGRCRESSELIAQVMGWPSPTQQQQPSRRPFRGPR